MKNYESERLINGENTYTLGSIDAPEGLVRAVESKAHRRGTSRASAIRQILAEAVQYPTGFWRGASCPRCGREMTLTDEECDEHPEPTGEER